ncbi:MAG: helix-turn-helix domain-containing protein [Acidimicrobiales bacterium]
MTQDTRLLLSPEEVAAALSISRTVVFGLLRTREIGSVRIGRSRRIPAKEVDAYIERLRQHSGEGQ